MKFGAMQGVLGEPVPEVFGLARALGFDGVELDWRELAQAAPGGALGPERRGALRDAARGAGVAIPSVCAGFLNQGGLAAADEALQRAGLEAVREGLRLCADLGAEVLLVPFFFKGDIGGPEGVERLLGHLRALAPEAEARGVTIGLEHTLAARETLSLIRAAGSPRVRTYWDMANAMALGYDSPAEAAALGPVLAQVHAKEFFRADGPAGSRQAPRFDALNKRPFGQGQVPVREVLAALRRGGYSSWVILETNAFGDRKDSARAALEVLKQA